MADILNYTSTPQQALANRTQGLFTGSVVGGGSVMNGMTFHRGSASDYDAWEQLGNPGWGWDGLFPYFKKASDGPRLRTSRLTNASRASLRHHHKNMSTGTGTRGKPKTSAMVRFPQPFQLGNGRRRVS